MHKNFIGLALAVGMFSIAAPAFASSLAAAPYPCDNISATPFLTGTAHITNDPDSGNHGNWATDAFTENISVWVGSDGVSYCANANTTDGAFVTTGPNSPNAGVALSPGIAGTFTGGETYTFASTSASSVLRADYSTTTPATFTILDSSSAGFSWWVNQVFDQVASSSGSSYTKTYWLQYLTSNNGSWIDSDPISGGNNTGDITNAMSNTYVSASGNDSSDGSQTSPFLTIGKALGVVANGGTVHVDATYDGTENVTVSQPVKIMASSGAKLIGSVTISADNVTVDGLDITNPTAGYGIIATDHSNLTITNNTIHGIGTTLTAGSAAGISFKSSSADVSTIDIENNHISNIGTTTLAYDSVGGGSSAKGIYLGDSNGPHNFSGVVIKSNTISNVTADGSVDYPAGRGAYGILVNHDNHSGASYGSTNGLDIENNTISNLDGLWAHGIGLEGNTPGATVKDNGVSNLVDHKVAFGHTVDAYPITVQDNASGATVSFSGNTLNGDSVHMDGSAVIVDAALAGDSTGTQVHEVGGYYYIGTNATSTIEDGAQLVSVNGTVDVYPGNYDIVPDNTNIYGGESGWVLPLGTSGVTLQGVDASGNPITDASNVQANIYSTQVIPNGSWYTQDLIAVFADNVSVKGIAIMNKLDPNKGIEVIGANNFTAKYDVFSPITAALYPGIANYGGDDVSKFGSGVYFNNNSVSAARTATIANNKFENSRISFNTLGNHWTIDITDNTFDGNVVWTSPAGGTDSYYPNLSVSVGTDFTGSTITVHKNSFVNMVNNQPIVKIYPGITATVDATKNYWGSTSGPTTDNLAANSGMVNYAPWYVNVGMTTLKYATNSSGGEASTTVDTDTPLTGTSGSVSVSADIPAGTVITGDSTWDGTIDAPTATNTTVTISGFDTSVTSAIAIGSSDSDLTFDKGVRLLFAGQADAHVGWYNHAGTFTEITDICSADSQTAGDALVAGGSCKINVSGDLVVWTKHFSTFTTYTQTAVPAPASSGGGGGGGGGGPIGLVGTTNGGGGGSGGGSVIPTAPAATGSTGGTGGQVLGAAAFNFTLNLTVGSRGNEVTELQKILIAEGDLGLGAPTGYFGGLTKAAVIKYQKAHGISPQSGYVGALTRAELNKGSTPASTSTGSHSNLTAQQKQSILDLLSSFGADQATINNVSAAL